MTEKDIFTEASLDEAINALNFDDDLAGIKASYQESLQ